MKTQTNECFHSGTSFLHILILHNKIALENYQQSQYEGKLCAVMYFFTKRLKLFFQASHPLILKKLNPFIKGKITSSRLSEVTLPPFPKM